MGLGFQSIFAMAGSLLQGQGRAGSAPSTCPRLSLCSDPLRTRGQPKGLSGLSAQPGDRHNPGVESSGSSTGNEPEEQNNKPPGTARSQGQPPQGQPSQAELRGY